MALIYRAEIRPTKLELIASWLPTQPWFVGRSADALALLGAYRFDDPAGDVGIETLLVDAAGEVVHVPMTYRGAPLAGGDAWLMGTMEHSVLGTRWVYDACADPVYASAMANAILTDGSQAQEWVETADGPAQRAATVSITSTGSPHQQVAAVGDVADLTVSTVGTVTTISAPSWVVEVARLVDLSGDDTDADLQLAGSWAAQSRPVRLAAARTV